MPSTIALIVVGLFAGIVGLIAGAVMKSRAPACYARIGERTAVERAEHIS